MGRESGRWIMDTRIISSQSANFDLQFWKKILSLNTCIPAIIDEFDPVTMRLKVTPAINTKEINEDGSVKYVRQVQLVDVPIAVSRSNLGLSITIPIQVGDICTLIFSQRCIDNFLNGIEISDPESGYNVNNTQIRCMDINDALAFPGVITTDIIHDYNTNAIEIRNDPIDGSTKSYKFTLSNQSMKFSFGDGMMSMSDGKMVINAPNGIEMNSNITITGDTNQTGDMIIKGDINNTGNTTSTGTISCDTVNADTNVTAGSVSLISHVHGGVAPGQGNTGTPI